MKILIVKTSALGDVIQSFGVLNDLHARFPGVQIDWVVEQSLLSLVAAHPLIRRAIPRQDLQTLRAEKYDLLFDLQGNCKSGLVTFLARSCKKIGFGRRSVCEWPNLLATRVHINVSPKLNMRLQYISLVQSYFQKNMNLFFANGIPLLSHERYVTPRVRLTISAAEQERLDAIVALPGRKIMVCPGSKWRNKQLRPDVWVAFLRRVVDHLGASLVIVGEERSAFPEIFAAFPEALFLEKPSFPLWQNAMSSVDLVLAVDSSALHLCGTTETPSFSFFGPTRPELFKPIGAQHGHIHGSCPYGRTFEKQCPLLRSCTTGACLRELEAEELFEHFLLFEPVAKTKSSGCLCIDVY